MKTTHPDASCPTVLVDTREQTPLKFVTFPTKVATLQTGDYSVLAGEQHFAVERKSLPDLVASLTTHRERFCRELHRLRGFDFARLLIIANRQDIEQGNYRSLATPESILASLAALEVRYRVPVVWSPSSTAAARQIEIWAWYWWREQRVRAGLKVPSSPKELLLPVTLSALKR